MRKIFNAVSIAAILIFASSCIKERQLDEGVTGKTDAAEVILRLKTPGGFSAPGSRALTNAEENTITDIYVLVFDKNNTLTAIKQGEEVDYNVGSGVGGGSEYSGTGSFSVTLEPSKTQLDTYNLVVLANASSILGKAGGLGFDLSAVSDKSYAGVTAKIWESVTGKMYPAGGTIPMWGESGAIVVEAGANNQTVTLTRSVARIDVGVGRVSNQSGDDRTAFTWDGKESDGTTPIPFELTAVYVISPNDRYAVVPGGTAGVPTVPAGTGAFTLAQSETTFNFPVAGGSTSRDIYIPEADVVMGTGGKPGDANHESRMALVVAGKYNGSVTPTYYRLDFAKNGNLLNVLRNHLYRFSISKVTGAGYPDVETAYKSLAMNMTVEILEWNENDMGNIVFDGQYYLSVNKGEFELTREARSGADADNKLKIRTDVPAGWTATVWNDLAGTVPVADDATTGTAWLSIDPTSGTGGGAPEMSLLMPDNTSGIDRTAYVHIKAGRLTYIVTVTQSMVQPFSLRVSPLELNFDDQQRWFDPATQAWTALTSTDITVTWQPADIPCTITRTNVTGDMGGTIPAATDQTGGFTFNFAPAAMTYSDVNPFAEREVTVTVKATNIYGETKYETVTIRQTRFDLLTEINSSGMALNATNREYGYMLDGAEHSFTIKSNVPWRVKSAVNNDADHPILDNPAALLGRAGGINTAGGELKFNVTQPALAELTAYKDATATVVLEDPTGKVGDVTVTLKALVCGANGVAVPLAIGTRGYDNTIPYNTTTGYTVTTANPTYLTHMYGGKCWMVQNSMEGTYSARYYQNNSAYDNGAYYTWAQADQANNACPLGWHLPDTNGYSGEVSALVTEINGNINAAHAKWWTGSAGVNHGAFAGTYNISYASWHYWGSRGYWCYGSGGQYFNGYSTDSMGTGSNTGLCFSVRCVQNQ